MTTRKNFIALSAAERSAFVNALLVLKNEVPSRIGLTNRYDDYVQMHGESMRPGRNWAHGGPAFCPWHRAFLRNLELDLQAIDSSVALPYWDWTDVAASNPASATSLWREDFLGGDGDPGADDRVTTGAFAEAAGRWRINVRAHGDNAHYLRRSFGRQTPTLPTKAQVVAALAETPYDRPPWAGGAAPSFRDRLEGFHGAGSLHNRVHVWVGGSMLETTSPNDPAFYLHHCMVDRLWAIWQRAHSQLPYVPGANAPGAPLGHRLGDAMQPWGGSVTVDSALDIAALGYTYDDVAAQPLIAAAPGAKKGSILPMNAASLRWTFVADLETPIPAMPGMFALSKEDGGPGAGDGHGHDGHHAMHEVQQPALIMSE